MVAWVGSWVVVIWGGGGNAVLYAKRRHFLFPISYYNFWCLKRQKLELKLTKLAFKMPKMAFNFYEMDPWIGGGVGNGKPLDPVIGETLVYLHPPSPTADEKQIDFTGKNHIFVLENILGKS